MSLFARPRRFLFGLVYSAYYTARDINYAHGVPTPKTLGNAEFKTYELYNLHGRDELLAELIERTDDGDVFYDVGANVGVYTSAVVSVGADVVAFEPNPKARGKLRSNIQANGFDATVLPFAVSDENGEATFYISSYPEVSSLFRPNATVSGGSVVEKKEVKTRTLDSLIDGLAEPDHIKIDVEGAGESVLRGSTRVLKDTNPTVYFEPHGDEPNKPEKEIFEDAGYTVDNRPEGWICTPETPNCP